MFSLLLALLIIWLFWKLGLIGRNGRGKTTFLNLLRGKYRGTGQIQGN